MSSLTFDSTAQDRIQLSKKDRYHALAISEHWNLNWIRRARALVVGAGALGNEVTKNLAMMGVREIVVVDFDTVDVSNLTRSVFFRDSDAGRHKVDCLAERLVEVNSDVKITPLHGRFADTVGLGLLRHMDMVFSCLDNRAARAELNEACYKVNKPWVNGGMDNLLGEVSAYIPGDGPCYECLLCARARAAIHEARSCAKVAADAIAQGRVPTTSTMGSIVAALQVQEAIKIGQGDKKPGTGGDRIVLDCLTNDFYTTSAQCRDGCTAHHRLGDTIPVNEWRSATTTAGEVIARAAADTDGNAVLKLSREVAIGLKWSETGEERSFDHPLHRVTISQARDAHGNIGAPAWIGRVAAGDPFADWTLGRLGVPAWDIIEIRTNKGPKFYELSGDAN
jgi:molybdopterin/thiamine biosynthesis adenylyltransferase